MTLIIFDCDGVLVDSEPIASAVMAEMITALGHPMTPAEALATFTGLSLADVNALAQRLLGRPVPHETGAHYGAALLDRFRQELKAVDGVRDTIAALPFARCVASSSTPERLRLSLQVTGLLPLFDPHVFSAAQVRRGKPAPDLFLYAAAQMQADPPNCIVVEDSVLGIEAARAAGMLPIGFAGGGHATDALAQRLAAAGAHDVVRSMAALTPLLAALAGR
ncbi:MAG TPA: HAD family hydrolase [Xanthobacteraceae bacterium]